MFGTPTIVRYTYNGNWMLVQEGEKRAW
jgi:hypothetical protein